MVQPTSETKQTGQAAPSALAMGALATKRREGREQRRAPGTGARIRIAFLRRPIALLSLVVLLLVLVLAIGAPLFGRYDPVASVLTDFEQPPSAQHWFGTDSAGRDVWSRLVWGVRNSLFISVSAVTIAMTIGTLLGAVSGFYRGILDALLMRITDGFLAFPSIVLILMLASILGPSIFNVVLVLSAPFLKYAANREGIRTMVARYERRNCPLPNVYRI